MGIGGKLMKYPIVLIFLLLLATPLLSHAEDKPLCEQYTCVAQFNWGYQFGGGSSGPSVEWVSFLQLPGTTDKLLIPGTSDAILIP
jgi:hypothetical protein